MSEPPRTPDHADRSRVAWLPLVIGLAIAVPLIWIFARGFSFDPKDVASPLIGKPAPAFSLTPLDGEAPVSLDALRGRPIVINFFASWCVPCRQEHAELTMASRLFADRARFVGVIYEDEPEAIRGWVRQQKYPTLVDPGGRMAIAYGVYGVPETFFVDAAGIIRDKVKGPVDVPRIRAALEALEASP